MAKATENVVEEVKKVEEKVVAVEKKVLVCVANFYNGIKEYKVGDEIKTDEKTAVALVKAKVAKEK